MVKAQYLESIPGLFLVLCIVICIPFTGGSVSEDKTGLASDCIYTIINYSKCPENATIYVSTNQIEECYTNIQIQCYHVTFISSTEMTENSGKAGQYTRYYQIDKLEINDDVALAKVSVMCRFDEGYGVNIRFSRENGVWGPPAIYGAWTA